MKREWIPSERFLRDGFTVVTDVLWIAPVGAALAALVWRFASPLPAYVGEMKVVEQGPPPISQTGDPFGGSGDPGPSPVNPSGFTLQAVRTGGSAILTAPGGTQRLVVIGEEAAPGWVLVETAPDHVTLEGAGGRLTVPFPASGLFTPEQAPAAPSPTSAADTPGLRLTPVQTTSGAPGLRLNAPAGTAPLAGVGLKDGDVITRIGSRDASSLTAADLSTAVVSSGSVEVRFERDGQAMITHTGRSGQ